MNIDCTIVNSFNYDVQMMFFFILGNLLYRVDLQISPFKRYFVTLVFISWMYCIVLNCMLQQHLPKFCCYKFLHQHSRHLHQSTPTSRDNAHWTDTFQYCDKLDLQSTFCDILKQDWNILSMKGARGTFFYLCQAWQNSVKSFMQAALISSFEN